MGVPFARKNFFGFGLFRYLIIGDRFLFIGLAIFLCFFKSFSFVTFQFPFEIVALNFSLIKTEFGARLLDSNLIFCGEIFD